MFASGTVSYNQQHRPYDINLEAIVSSDCGDTVTTGTVAYSAQHRANSIELRAITNPHSSNGIASHTVPQDDNFRPSSISLQALDYTCGGSCQGTTGSGGFSWPDPDIQTINLGAGTGEVWFNVNAYNVPDKFAVNWNGSWVFESGFLGSSGYNSTPPPDDICSKAGEQVTGTGSQWYMFDKTAAQPDKCFLYVWGPYGGTAWEVTNYCPGDEKSHSIGPGPTPCSGGSFITLPTLDAEGNEVP